MLSSGANEARDGDISGKMSPRWRERKLYLSPLYSKILKSSNIVIQNHMLVIMSDTNPSHVFCVKGENAKVFA